MDKLNAQDARSFSWHVKGYARGGAALAYWSTLGTADVVLMGVCYWRDIDPVGFAEARSMVLANRHVLDQSLMPAFVTLWVLVSGVAIMCGLTRFRLVTPSVLFFSFLSSAIAALAFGWSFSTLWLTAMAVMAFFAVMLFVLERRRLNAEVRAEMAAE